MKRRIQFGALLLIGLAGAMVVFTIRTRKTTLPGQDRSVVRLPPTELDGEIQEIESEGIPRVLKISPGVFLERANLSEDRVREIQAIARPGHQGVSEIPEFELAPKEIRTVEEAFDRIKFISMVEYPRFYFFDADYWYFSGGGRVVRADDFSDGYRVSKTGYITMWYERKQSDSTAER